MSVDYGVKTVTPGQQTIYNVPANSGWVVIQNESPYKLSCSMDGTGSSRAIPIQGIDKVTIPTTGFNGNIILTPIAILNAQATNQAPSYEVNLEAFGQGEEPTGVYPVALSRSVLVGGDVNTLTTTQVIDRQNTAGSLTLAAAPTGEADAVQIYNNGNINAGNQTRQGVVTMALGEILRFIQVYHTLPSANVSYDMYVDGASGELRIGLAGFLGGGKLRFNSGGGSDIVLDFINGNINIQTPPVTVSGSVSGSVSLYQDFTGAVKRTTLVFNNYKSAAAQTLALPVPYASGGSHWQVDELQGGQVEALLSGTPQTFSVRTALPTSSGGGSQIPLSLMRGWSDGACRTTFDTVRVTSTTAACSGVMTIIGN